MQLATNSVLSQPPLAAMPQLSEKPRLGFATKKTAWNPGPNVCNFTVTLGLRATVVENGVRKTYSARYYNPLTGRFVSRDPEDGYANDPATLHKYLYAHGDPVNLKDPRGREAMVATAEIDWWTVVKSAAAATAVTVAVACVLNEAAQLLQGLATDMTAPIISIQLGYCSAKVKRGCSCTAKCTCHVIGMPNHMNTGIYVFGAATASSCPAAQTLAKIDAGESCGGGEHAQHCSYQCDGR